MTHKYIKEIKRPNRPYDFSIPAEGLRNLTNWWVAESIFEVVHSGGDSSCWIFKFAKSTDEFDSENGGLKPLYEEALGLWLGKVMLLEEV